MKLANSPFSYFGTSAGYTTPKSILGSLETAIDVTPGNYTCDQCSDPNCAYPYGMQLINEEVKIAFPSGCCDWFVSWQQDYRDGSINTGPGGQTFYVEAEINPCLTVPDNSPTFNTPANNIFCINQCNTMDNSATDLDRSANGPDSLVYTLVSPLQGHKKPVTYNKPYNYLDPTLVAKDSSACIGFNLDNQTGILQFQPKIQEISVMAIEVDEWRPDANGIYQKIGSVIRDIEFYVSSSCPNATNIPPVIPGINGGNTYSQKSCGGDFQTCFNVKAFDLVPTDTVKIAWNGPGDMKGATFTLIANGQKWPTAVFCWFYTDSMERIKPYTFTVTAWISNPPHDSVSKTFSFYILPPPKVTHSATNGTCGIVNFKAVPDSSSSSIDNYLWVGQGNPGSKPMYISSPTGSYQYYKKGWYGYSLLVTGTLAGCYESITDSVYVTPSLEIDRPIDTIVCAKSPSLKLQTSIGKGTPPYSYLWNTGETTQTKSAIITSDTAFKVTVTDATGCTDFDSTYIRFQNPPLPKPAITINKCANSSLSINASDLGSQVVWTAIIGGKTIPNYSYSNPLTVNDSGIYIATAQNSNICPGTDSFIVKPLQNNTSILNEAVCYGSTFGFPFEGKIMWIDSGSGWIPDSTGNTLNIHVGNYKVYQLKYLNPIDINGAICIDTILRNFLVNPPSKELIASPFPQICMYQDSFDLKTYENSKYPGGEWVYPRNQKAIKNGYLFPSILGQTSNDSILGYLYYSYSIAASTPNCLPLDSQRIIIWSKVYAGPDINIWKECGKYILNNENVTPQFGGKWTALPGTPPSCLDYNGDTAFFNPDSVVGNGIYGFVYTYFNKADTTACNGADTMYINLIDKPVITIAPIGNLCDDGNPVALNISPAGGILEIDGNQTSSALAGFNIIPKALYPGYHRLKYIIRNTTGNSGCTDTSGIGFKVIPAPDAYFSTSDSSWQYCASHGPIKLIPITAGGLFFGSGVYNKGSDYYFEPSRLMSDSTLVNAGIVYDLPYNNNLCSVIYSQNITVVPNAVIKIISDSILCGNNNVFTIQAAAANCDGYYWSSPDANGQDAGTFKNPVKSSNSLTVNYIPGAAQLKQKYFTIYLAGWGAKGCDTVYTSLKIRIKPGPQAEFSSRPLLGCDPVDEHFKNLSYDSSSSIVKYEWNFGDGSPSSDTTNPTHIYHSTLGDTIGLYFVTLTVTSSDGCSNSKASTTSPILVYADPVPIISAKPSFTTLDKPKIRFGLSPQSLWIDPNDTTNIYLWHFIPQGLDTGGYATIANPEHTYMDTGKFTVTLNVTVNNGCTGTDSAIAVVDVRPAFAIFIPNIFLPGSRIDPDKTFKPVLSSYSKFTMTISSRWGNMVYNTNDPNMGWDGRILGQMVSSDVYIYKIEVSDLYGKTYKYNGNVTMMR